MWGRRSRMLRPFRTGGAFRFTHDSRVGDLLRRVEKGSVTRSEVVNAINTLQQHTAHQQKVVEYLSQRNASAAASMGSRTSPLFIRSNTSLLGLYSTAVFGVLWTVLLHRMLTSEDDQGKGPFNPYFTSVHDEYWPVERIAKYRAGQLSGEDDDEDEDEDERYNRDRRWFDILENNPIAKEWAKRNRIIKRKKRLEAIRPLPEDGFDCVCGNEEPKEDLQDIVAYLRDPSAFRRMDVSMPRGVMLSGDPGTGKTLMARALAAEAGVPFLSCTGASFEQMYVGVGSTRMRKMFKRARELSPCIIYIDEIDAIGGKRDGKTHSRETLNQLLADMDGFNRNSGVVVVASTNTPEMLDSALTRSGRFDRNVTVPMPSRNTRADMFRLFLKNKNTDDDVDYQLLGNMLSGASGADIENVVNTAGIESAKQGLKSISQRLLVEATDIVNMGRARVSRMRQTSREELTSVAYHEAGHLLTNMYCKDGPVANKITIMPRGQALGHVSYNKGKKEFSETRTDFLTRVVSACGGRVGEEIYGGKDEVTTGAASDLSQATKTVKLFLLQAGMSHHMGTMAVQEKELPDKQKEKLYEQTRIIIEACMDHARDILNERSVEHKKLVEALLEKETMSLAEVKEVIGFKEEHVRPPPLKVLYDDNELLS